MKNKIRMAAMILAAVAGTAGIASAQDYGYYDHGNRYYDRGGFDNCARVAHDFGARDGATVAREDMWRGKPFNPNPRGPYDDADHGYRRAFGSIHEYRANYAQAYRAAYQNAFRERRYYR